MDVNEVRVAEDKDFEVLKIYLSRNDGWTLEYEQSKTSVWTRQASESDFKMIRVSIFWYILRNVSLKKSEFWWLLSQRNRLKIGKSKYRNINDI